MSVNFMQSKTKENLMRSFAGESQAKNRYKFAADEAKQQNMYFIEQIFKQTAHQEEQHAKIFWDLLKEANGQKITVDGDYPVENVTDLIVLLKDAQKNEYEECNWVYPEFQRVAEEEGFSAIAAKYKQVSQIERTHGDRFGTFAVLMEQNKLFTSDTETEWFCLNCGNIHKGTSAPKQCPFCLHPQGYFVPFKYYKFLADNYSSGNQV